MKRKYILLALFIATVISGCVQQSPKLKFTAGPCDETIDPYGTDMGVKEVNWIDETTLEVVVYVNINCAEEIEDGDFQLFSGRIILQYTAPQCEECVFCLCAHRLVYRFTNLEKKEYLFEIERIM